MLSQQQMPPVEELIDRLCTGQIYINIGSCKGVLASTTAAETRKKTAFVTPFGQFEFNVMPFEFQGAPSTFQHMMDKVLEMVRSIS